MTQFWILAALLVAACMAVLLRPLLRRMPMVPCGTVTASEVYREQLRELDEDLRRGLLDADQRTTARDELGRRLLDDGAAGDDATKNAPRSVVLAALLLALLPSAAILLYLQLGNPMAFWTSGDRGVLAAHDGGHELSNAQVEALVNQLAQRLRTQPDDAQGWYMLGRSYAAMERATDAASALAKAVALEPDEAMLRADYADVLATVEGGSLQGGARSQIERALALDANQPKALALAASAAMQRGDKAEAIARWEHLYRLLPPQSQTATRIAQSLADARGAARTAAPTPAQVAGSVVLGPGAPRRPGPDETLFVYALPVDGSRMPLAVLRRQARDLPLAFRLDDSLAMRPDRLLSGQQQVLLEARLSADGNALPQAGDMVGRAGPVDLGSGDNLLVIGGQVAGQRSSR